MSFITSCMHALIQSIPHLLLAVTYYIHTLTNAPVISLPCCICCLCYHNLHHFCSLPTVMMPRYFKGNAIATPMRSTDLTE